MNEHIFIIVLLASFCYNPTLARPDLLKQQRYEFQEAYTSTTHDQIASFPQNARLEAGQVLVQHEPVLWSHRHPNEVSAFAEMFRQSYNQMIEKNHKMMPYHASSYLFMPVTYELYHVPEEVSWENYFGNQQQYVSYQTEQMSRKLINDLEQGRVSPQDLMNPEFFIAHAASALDRVHPVHNEFENSHQQVANNFGETYQQHEFGTFNTQQQQQHQMYSESANHRETENKDQVLLYNHQTGEFQYGPVWITQEVPVHEEPADAMISNANNQHPLYVQHPSVRFNNEMSNNFNQEVEKIEIHTPLSVETPRSVQQLLNERVKPSPKPLPNADEEFYGSTYDQQPIYDLQFVESVSTTPKPSKVNVMPLVRKKANVQISTTTESLTTTSSTTTKPPTTESNVMSMLPDKKPSFNYTDIYQKVRDELDRQMKQMIDNQNEETHFMGMTSNADHGKLSYETVPDEKDHGKPRGDQPVEIDDYVAEDHTYTEPTVIVPTTSAKSPTTYPSISSTAKPIPAPQNPFYSAPLAPFPTMTIKAPNLYYSAPLAPFPDELQVPQIVEQSQTNHSELYEMTQQEQVLLIGQSNDAQFLEPEFQDQQYDVIDENSEFQIPHDMQQYENVQQRYIDIAGGPTIESQRYEKQLPPEQLYRNPDLKHAYGGLDQNSEFPAHVKETTESSTPVDNSTSKKSWFQRQYLKLKHIF